MKKVLYGAAVALGLVVLLSLFGERPYSRTEFMFDTVITIKAPDKGAVSACFDEIARLENLLSVYVSGSEVSKINDAPCGEEVKVSEETYNLLKKAKEYKKLTSGAFDITLKPVTDLWNIQGGGYVPTESELETALLKTGDLILSDETRTVKKPKPHMAIDLGGIAKGYAGDRVREILKEHGVKDALCDLGGNIVAVGRNGRNKWKIGLQHPQKIRGTAFGEIEAEDKSVVTSGGYERYFEKDGKTYHHITDPKTGKNPENGVFSVTVISDSCTEADALSTACFVLGKDASLEIAQNFGAEVVFFTDIGIFYTEGTEIEIY